MTKRARPFRLKEFSPRRYSVIPVLLYLAFLVYFVVNYFVYASNTTKVVAVCNCNDGMSNIQSEFDNSDSTGTNLNQTERNSAKVDAIKKNKITSNGLNRDKGSSKNAPSIDLVNDYYPPIDFKFVFPEISPEIDTTQDIFMIVLVNSGARGEKFRNKRNAIRQTWANRSNCEQHKALKDERLKGLRWIQVFVVGKARQGTNDDELNMAEAKQHNDMLIGNITDNYINNIVKLYMGLLWASRFNIKYILKTDDDVYVRVPRVLDYLVNAKFPKQFSGGPLFRGTKVRRRIRDRWAISYKYYEKEYYPNYNPGAFLVLSSDLLNRLFNHVYQRKPFHVDDAYVGVALHDLGVKITKINSFALNERSKTIIRNSTDCKISNVATFGHKFDPEFTRYLHARVMRLACGRTNLKC